ncbi:MAG: class I SAM-dependent methyltransferase [Pseudomonadota bacterium]
MQHLEDFKNRLIKSNKHLSKWANRHQLEAYRLYDRDIPQFPLAIDRYANRLHVSEYDTGWQQSEEEHTHWIASVKTVLAELFECPLDSIAYKLRQRQKGNAQYEKTGLSGNDFVIVEQGRKFWVNLDNYLDTGLFLDHRNTRKEVGEAAYGKRVLNLYAYTGSFSVYAATGGALETITVDMSNTYLDWAKRNFELNNIAIQQHHLIRADVFRYLDDAILNQERFDLIIMDPPSFSNSAKMIESLDTQRDHLNLIEDCLELLQPNGTLYFSTNKRDFKLHATLESLCKNISQQSVPEDFRNKKIHQCFRFNKP